MFFSFFYKYLFILLFIKYLSGISCVLGIFVGIINVVVNKIDNIFCFYGRYILVRDVIG